MQQSLDAALAFRGGLPAPSLPPRSPSLILPPSSQADKLRARFHYNLDSDIDPEWIAPDVLDHLRNEYSAREVGVVVGEGLG